MSIWFSSLDAYFKSTRRSQQTNDIATANMQLRTNRLVQRILTVIAQRVMRGPIASISPDVPDEEKGRGRAFDAHSQVRRPPNARRHTTTRTAHRPKTAITALLLLSTPCSMPLPHLPTRMSAVADGKPHGCQR
jgi:hypothetical protein